MDPFVGEIRITGFNFAPTGWALCNGQILPISQNTALFSLLGTYYGGDGRSTFALPNLQDRSAVHWGQGPGLSPRVLGETGGEASVTLAANEMPAHSHALLADAAATTGTPSPTVDLAQTPGPAIYGGTSNPVAMAASALSVAGGGQPHENRQPYLVLNYIIALQGIYPPRS
jgi:microcystin-dependent protein